MSGFSVYCPDFTSVDPTGLVVIFDFGPMEPIAGWVSHVKQRADNLKCVERPDELRKNYLRPRREDIAPRLVLSPGTDPFG